MEASSRDIKQKDEFNDSSDSEGDNDNDWQMVSYEDDLKTGTMCLGINRSYVNKWGPRHGWREFYQNWCDSIIETNKLEGRKFIKRPEDKQGFIIFKELHPDSKKELGYIKWSSGAGTVEITNYNARLSGKSLGLGVTSKQKKPYLAGTHGEGYKIACLTLMEQCLDLEPPSKSIETTKGSIILDRGFSNQMYPKGILLERRKRAKEFKFGYNLAQGEINRDREAVAEILADIWAQAIQSDEATTLKEYFTMLQEDRAWADVKYASDIISEEMAKRIRQYLRDKDADNKLFYYNGKDGAYSRGVRRALEAVLAFDPRTKEFKMCFKDGKVAEMDLLLHENTLMINERWLDFQTSHRRTRCSLFEEAFALNLNIKIFSCGHVLTELYGLILVELARGERAEGKASYESNKSVHPYSDHSKITRTTYNTSKLLFDYNTV
ncbi:hypothetical protein G7Y89_g7815 [Cudoniella acicularis]|uniref:Uncharacterized protein n=1 Tax=Cudoniella acicularis TaxID=354080 RepID=A0A8H4RHP8_9HELO|nr:hypothetical protein G7Y89_g7815 [Cudoniella acicularis]